LNNEGLGVLLLAEDEEVFAVAAAVEV